MPHTQHRLMPKQLIADKLRAKARFQERKQQDTHERAPTAPCPRETTLMEYLQYYTVPTERTELTPI